MTARASRRAREHAGAKRWQLGTACAGLGLSAALLWAGSATVWYRVTRVEDLGSDRLLYGSLRDLAPDTKMIVNLPHTIRLDVTPGESYELACKSSDLKFFDPKTGLRTAPRPLRAKQ